jgi:hypothetical protein
MDTFSPGDDGYHRMTVDFDGQKANVYTGRVDDPPILKAGLSAPDEIAAAAQQVAEMAAETGRTTLNLTMNLTSTLDKGIPIGKAAEGIALKAALDAGGTLALNSDSSFARVRSIMTERELRTDWDRETQRASSFIEAAAREFKKKYPENSEVIVIGHSAFNEAIDQIPTKIRDSSGDEKQLIDMRVMCSVRTQQLTHPDPDHTVFVEQKYDLPGSAHGDIWNSSSIGNLSSQGTVITITDHPGAFFPIALELEAHTDTARFSEMHTMTIERQGKSVSDFHSSPWEVANLQLRAIEHGESVDDNIIETLQRAKAAETRVGGVSISKPADVPIDPEYVSAIAYDSDRGRLYIKLKDGGYCWLPDIGERSAVEAAITVFAPPLEGFASKAALGSDGTGEVGPFSAPEVDLDVPRVDSDGRYWRAVNYKGNGWLSLTAIGDTMVDADAGLSQIAFEGSDPRVSGIHNYLELALDNRSSRGDRIWMVPGEIVINRDTPNELTVSRCRMMVCFEAWDLTQTEEYLSGRAVGWHDPAGDYLATQLTEEFDTLERTYPSLAGVRTLAGPMGILIWARKNNIQFDRATWPSVAERFNEYERGFRSEAHHWQLIDVQGGQAECFPAQKPLAVNESAISRPALIFNEYGLSRILWPDSTESVIKYDASSHFPTILLGRRGHRYNLLYDSSFRLVALTGEDNYGIAALRATVPSLLAEGVIVDPSSLHLRLTRHSAVSMERDIDTLMNGRLDSWIKSEKDGGTDVGWLWSQPLESDVTLSYPTLAMLAAAAIFALILTNYLCGDEHRERDVLSALAACGGTLRLICFGSSAFAVLGSLPGLGYALIWLVVLLAIRRRFGLWGHSANARLLSGATLACFCLVAFVFGLSGLLFTPIMQKVIETPEILLVLCMGGAFGLVIEHLLGAVFGRRGASTEKYGFFLSLVAAPIINLRFGYGAIVSWGICMALVTVAEVIQFLNNRRVQADI